MNELLRLTLLGSPRLQMGSQLISDFATNKAQALLFYLVVTGQPHSREHLATLLWNEMTDVQAKKNLRTVLPDLRRLLGDHLLIERQTVAFQRTKAYWLDVEVLRRSLTPRQATTDLAVRQAAVELYAGEFLSGFYVHNAPTFDAWVLEQREQLHTLVVTTLTGLVDEHAQRADYAAALAANRRLLALEPWSEPVHRQQMLLLAQTGERAAALVQYETCQRILAAEFGVAPSAETTALYQQIRHGEIGGQSERESRGLFVKEPVEKAGSAEPTGSDQLAQTPSQAEPMANEMSTPARVLAAEFQILVHGHNLPQRTTLYGRQEELRQIQKWIVEDGCRLVGIFGIGGQGKTTLAAALVHTLVVSAAQLSHNRAEDVELAPGLQFQRVIWQSLLNAPPLTEVLQEWLYILSDQTVTTVSASLDQQFSQLLTYLRRQRCLLVLDNVESILQAAGHGGDYRPSYETYGQLLHHLATGEHQSCLLLTSREKPHHFTHLEDDTPAIRFLTLAGLSLAAGQAKLRARGVIGDAAVLSVLVQHYSGNPLALRLAAETVHAIFDGDVAAFLQAEALVFDDIRDVLDQQFARLAPLERELLTWLAIAREPVPFSALRDLLVHSPAPRLVLEAVRALQRRSLLEKYDEGFGLQNVVLEYITALLVENIGRELATDFGFGLAASGVAERQPPSPTLPAQIFLSALNSYALVLAQTKEYVRASQMRLLLQPVAERLAAQLGSTGAERQLQSLLVRLRMGPPAPGYIAANLLHLLLALDVDLRGYDFSQLYFRQVYLRGVSLPQTNFAQANFTSSVFTEPLGRIPTLVFSPDGQFLAAGTREGTIHFWRTADQQLAQVIQAHDQAISQLVFAQPSRAGDGTHFLLASASDDLTVGLWSLVVGAETPTRLRWRGQQLRGHRQRVVGIGFNADSQRLVSIDLDGGAFVWDVLATGPTVSGHGQVDQYFSSDPHEFRASAFSHDGQILAIGRRDGLVQLWQMASRKPGLVLAGHTSAIMAMAFSPDRQMLASASRDGRICLWSLPAGGLQQAWEAAPGIIPALAFSPDGHTLASSHWDRTVRLWACSTGQLRHTLRGHTHVIRTLAFSPQLGPRPMLASGGSDQTIRVWDVQTGQPLYVLRGHHQALNAIALSPDGAQLAAVGYDEVVHLWPWRDANAISAHRALRGASGLLHTVAFSPDGQMVASAGRDPAIYLWDATSGQLRQTLHGHTQDIYKIAFHPDGNLLASGSADGTVQLWNLHNGHLIDIFQIDPVMIIYALAFTPDGGLLASAGGGPFIRLWDMRQAPMRELAAARKTVQYASEREVLTLAFSPDGAMLASGGTTLIHLWDRQSGESLMILRQHIDWVTSVAFSPDGTTLVSGSDDRTICLWDVARGALRAVLQGHRESVSSVVFSADGAYILSGSADGTIKFWDSQTGDCLKTLLVDGPYAGMNITGIIGITEAQMAALKTLGAREN